MSAQRPVRILFASSEVVGFAKTGGLADVAASLPRALAARGHDVALILPLYAAVRRGPHSIVPTGIEVTVSIGNRAYIGRLQRTTLAHSSVPVYLVEQGELFERDDPDHGRGLYQFTGPDGRKHDYGDNAERFIFFSRAVMEALPHLQPHAEILHCNDWQTALIPAYLRELYTRQSHWQAAAYAGLKSLLTIHNIAYQGNFPPATMALTGLPQRLFNHRHLEFYGQLSFLKGGCVFADALNTVSPRYAEEIQTMLFGCGLEGVLAERRGVLSGIVNGVDYNEWNPAIDPHIAKRYTADTVSVGKSACKQALQREMGLPERADVPLMGMVARLVEQKGIGLLIQSAGEILSQELQLVLLGEGDPILQRQLHEIESRYRDKVGLRLGYDEGLAHRIEAGSDMFLMPSRYEPSGLNQLYSLRYGTVPIVRSVGGLADTITDCTPETIANGTATGFRFGPYTPVAFQQAVHRAVTCWQTEPDVWQRLMQIGMGEDWSWNRSAGEYEQVYSRLIHPDRHS
jgi:starch synthase